MTTPPLDGRVALITGGARGMGAEHARALVDAGARVVIADVLDALGRELADEIGSSATYVHLDVTDRGEWSRAVVHTIDTFGHLDTLINNAGIVMAGATEEFEPELWNQVLAVNLTGAFNGITVCAPALRAAAPSSIINVSSTAGLKGYPALAAYTASKFGLRGLTKSIALEFAGAGIRCNSVHPGAVDTPMIEGFDLPQTHVAMHRIGRTDEVSALIVFLAGSGSSFCTGAEFVIDGGETCGLPTDFTA